MGTSLTVEFSSLKDLIKELESPVIKEGLNRLPQKRGIAALVAQAIADNFAKEGPGWKPLSPATIRASVSKKLKAQLSKMTDAEIMKHESNTKGTGGSFRKILQRTGLLYNTVTVLNFSGSKNGKQGRNIYSTEGNKLIFGTDLAYAAMHNEGDPSRHVPKREFMVIRKIWMEKIEDFVTQESNHIISNALGDSS